MPALPAAACPVGQVQEGTPSPLCGGEGAAVRGGCGSGRIGPVHSREEEEKVVTCSSHQREVI